MGLPSQFLALLPGLCLGLSWAAGNNPTMGNSSILGTIRTGTTTKGTNATTETTAGNNAITENNGTPASNFILGNSATTGNNSTLDYKITLETKHVLGNNATMGNNNAVTGISAITETKILGISNIMGNSTIAEIHIYLGSKTRVTNSITESTTVAGTLGNKSSESNASMGNSVTTGNRTLQIKNILGNITTDSQAQGSSDILGSRSITETRATESSGTSETSSTTGTRATQIATWGTNAITPENVYGTQESVSMGTSTPLGSSTFLGTSAITENKILENTITENTAEGNSSTTESNAILESRLTTGNLDTGSKISENVTLGNGTTRSRVSTGISEDTLGNNATMLQLLGSNATMGSANTGSKTLARTISPLEEDTLCRDSGINETALCRGEFSSGESAENISLRDFICQKRAQGSPLNRKELEVRLSRAKCKDPGIIQTLALIFSYANLKELQDILVQLNGSLCHAATTKALWTLMLQGQLDFKDTPSLRCWFQGFLQPFLTSLSRDERCFPLNTLNCKQYQAFVQVLDMEFEGMSQETQEAVYTTFQRPVLTRLNTSGLSCVPEANSSTAWLDANLGRFSQYATYEDLVTFNTEFDGLQVLDRLTLRQLAQLAAARGSLNETMVQGFPNNFPHQESLLNRTKEVIEIGLSFLTNGSVSVTTWTDVRMLFYFYFLQSKLLPTENISCPAFRAIVSNGPSVLKGREEEVYHHIYSYLTGTPSRPRCYNLSDPLSHGWFTAYLGHYIHLSSVDDIRDFLGYDQQLLQMLASQQDSLQLFSQQDIPRNTMWTLTSALLAETPNITISELPDKLLCFSPEAPALHSLGEEALWKVIRKLNDNCGPSHRTDTDAWALRAPLPPSRQLATLLVSQIPAFNQSTLVALGQQAVGLTKGQIAMLSEEDVAASVEALGKVIGWDQGQVNELVSKLTSEQLLVGKLETLGSLVPGLPTTVLCALSPANATHLARAPIFLRGLRGASTYLKRVFTNRIIVHPLPITKILEIVPLELVPQIPSSFLLWDNLTTANLSAITEQPWEPEQASGFFQQGLASSMGSQVARLSASILQGFQCQEVSQLPRAQFSSLVREVQKQKAILNVRQLSCMANLLALHNLTNDFADYPPDLLLFYDLRHVDKAKCREFISRASQGNLTLLSGLSAQKKELLNMSLTCLGNPGTSLSKEDLSSLGGLVCDMEPAVILESDPHILDNLKRCSQLTAEQRDALNALLRSGATWLGAPRSWNLGRLWSLGPLAFYINSSLWKMVNEEVSKDFYRDVITRYQAGSLPRSLVQSFVDSFLARDLSMSRANQEKGRRCSRGNITAQVIQDELFMVRYDCKQLKSCLGSKVLKANLNPLLQHPLPRECQSVVKGKLSEIYPGGVPENQLKLIASLVYLYSNDEISHWNITSRDTVVYLLGSDVALENQTQNDGKSVAALNADLYCPPFLLLRGNDQITHLGREEMGEQDKSPVPISRRQVQLVPDFGTLALETDTIEAVINKFLELNGTMTGAMLVAIGGFRLCWMSPQQIEAIRPVELRSAGALDISSCAQERKDDLYEKAKKAFSGSNGSTTYYHYIRPYLGGASVEDLKHLARANISMDIDTFTCLNPEVLQNLSLSNVAKLLGRNVADLRKARSHPAVSSWLQSQNQSALEALGFDRAPEHLHASPATTGKPPSAWITNKGHNSASPGGHTTRATTSGCCVLAPLHLFNAFGFPIGLILILKFL